MTSSRSCPTPNRPVCKILDYGKYKFLEQKKAAEARKKQKVVEIKEIKLRPGIDDHDYGVKMKAVRGFSTRATRSKSPCVSAAAKWRIRISATGSCSGSRRKPKKWRKWSRAFHGRPPDGDDPGAKVVTPPDLAGQSLPAKLCKSAARETRAAVIDLTDQSVRNAAIAAPPDLTATPATTMISQGRKAGALRS